MYNILIKLLIGEEMAALNGTANFRDQRFLVMGVIEQGFGDISTTVKIVDVLKQYTPLENLALTLIGGAGCYDKLQLLKSSLGGGKVLDASNSSEYCDSGEAFGPALAILFPGSNRGQG